jgi:hypothetical protein
VAANRAGIEVTLTHHDATFDHQRRGCETHFVSAQQCANHDIATGFHLSVGLHGNAAAQFIKDQGL